MTAYTVSFRGNNDGTTTQAAMDVAIRAGSFPIKIMLVEADGCNLPGAYRYEASTISGGTVVTPRPMREGAPAASATSRYRSLSFTNSTRTPGTAVTITGTQVPIRTVDISSNAWSPPTEVMVAPGSTFWFQADDFVQLSGTNTSYFTYFAVTFDEQRVSYSV